MAQLTGKASIPNRMFSNKDLCLLFIPLVIEKILEYTVGLADSMMVAKVGEEAVSGISLIEPIMSLLIGLFAALTVGGSVIIGRYLGKKDKAQATSSAIQLMRLSVLFSLALFIVVFLLRGILLDSLYPDVSGSVRQHAYIYMSVVAFSIPAIAIYNASSSIYRTLGNTGLPMKIILLSNIMNVVGNALSIFVLNLGTFGIALSTLIARAAAAVILTVMLSKQRDSVYVEKIFSFDISREKTKQIFKVGIPYGFETVSLYVGRLILTSLVATLGTASIAANSIGNTVSSFQILPGMAINLGVTTVIARCIGADDMRQTRYYAKKILLIVTLSHLIACLGIYLLQPTILKIYDLSTEATVLAAKALNIHAVSVLLFWPTACVLPVVLRSGGDAKFTMAVSLVSMFAMRIELAYFLSAGIGILGVWIAMGVDWIFKTCFYLPRYLGEKWVTKELI